MRRNTILSVASFWAVASFIILPVHINAICNLCTDYGIACINETSFNNCIGGEPQTDRAFTCPGNRLCSATSLKCVDVESGGQADCEASRGCGICDGVKTFACTSRSTYAQCNGQELTNITGVCPSGLVCDAQSGEICKNECNRPDVLECDVAAAL